MHYLSIYLSITSPRIAFDIYRNNANTALRMLMSRSAKLLAAAAATHLLAVLRLFCIDLAQPPFTAVLLPSELRRVSRSVLLVHRHTHHMALPQLNATLHSLAALPGAKELRITLWQPLHTSGKAAGDATAHLLRSIRHLGLAISHLRPATCRLQTCRRLAAGSIATMGDLRTAAAIVADKLVDGLDVAFAGEVAHSRRTAASRPRHSALHCSPYTYTASRPATGRPPLHEARPSPTPSPSPSPTPHAISFTPPFALVRARTGSLRA